MPAPLSAPTTVIALDPWWALFVYLGVLGSIVGLGEGARAALGWRAETSRKLVHSLVGLTLATAPLVCVAAWPFLVLGALFVVINGAALRREALAGMHGTDRISYGTVYFPIAFVLLVLLLWERPAVFVITMATLALADTAGTIVGERVPVERRRAYTLWRDEKTIQGSAAVALTTAALVFVGVPALADVSPSGAALLAVAAVTAVIAALCEGMSRRGSDNLSLPLGVGLILHLLVPLGSAGAGLGVYGWIGAAFALGLAAHRLHLLTASGAAAATVLGALLFGASGAAGAVPLMIFFALSSALSKFTDRVVRRGAMASSGVKGSRRDLVQVFANGGAAMACALLATLPATGALIPDAAWYTALVASLAAATADTWATELGAFSRTRPRSLWPPFAPVDPGESGGVTRLGTAASIAGAAVTSLCAWPFFAARGEPCRAALIAATAGVFACAVDSVLGATLQARYRDPVTGVLVERPGGLLVSGLAWMNNDTVNLMSTVTGAAAAVVINMLL